jgi:hypothetical protein
MADPTGVVDTAAGRVRGTVAANGIQVFRGFPYGG